MKVTKSRHAAARPWASVLWFCCHGDADVSDVVCHMDVFRDAEADLNIYYTCILEACIVSVPGSAVYTTVCSGIPLITLARKLLIVQFLNLTRACVTSKCIINRIGCYRKPLYICCGDFMLSPLDSVGEGIIRYYIFELSVCRVRPFVRPFVRTDFVTTIFHMNGLNSLDETYSEHS